jgi:broad specificity phosphatase PhoE
MQVYFIRHGQTDSNLTGFAIHADNNGPLNTVGVGQVEQTSRLLFKIAPKIDLIVSSPYIRTQQTAEIIAKAYNLPVFLEKELSEADFRDMNGKTIDEVYETLQKQSQMSGGTNSTQAGETWQGIADRMVDVIKQTQQAGFQNIIVVSHSITIHIAITKLLSLEAGSQADIHQAYDNASISAITNQNGAWTVQFLNRCR